MTNHALPHALRGRRNAHRNPKLGTLSRLALVALASCGGAWARVSAGARHLWAGRAAGGRSQPDGGSRFPVSILDPEAIAAARTRGELRDLLFKLQRRRAQFATEAAHELMTPLAAQRCVGELSLRQAATAQDLRETIATMLEESQHMQGLIDGLLLVARADSGMLGTPTTTIDAAQIAARAVSNMAPLAAMHEQSISLHAPGGLMLIVGEPTLLLQVLLNIIHNAITHTPRGTHIRVCVEAEHQLGVLICVTDNGQGMRTRQPGQEQRRYARRQADRVGRASLGMGMKIAASLVRSQGGKMAVTSQPGAGTQVRLRFPVSSGQPAAEDSSNCRRRCTD